MATTLLGGHIDSTCPNCNFTFSRDAQDCDDAPLAVCPNCGAKFTPPSPPRVLAGDRVLIDRTAFQFRRPRRWEVVAFRRWRGGQDLVVKRVVGLPGETIQIKDGDIYVDGQIQRKTLRQQRALRILVHDDDYAGRHAALAAARRRKQLGPSARTPRPCGKHRRRHWLACLQPRELPEATIPRHPPRSPITAFIIAGVSSGTRLSIPWPTWPCRFASKIFTAAVCCGCRRPMAATNSWSRSILGRRNSSC